MRYVSHSQPRHQRAIECGRVAATFPAKMKRILVPTLLLSSILPALADWPQWRGPDRNGVAAPDAKLPALLPEEYEPELVWKFEGIPSDHYGGHGSAVVAGGKVFLSIVWHRDEPTETRRIDGDVLSSLGFRGTSGIPEEIRTKMETDRLGLSPRLRGTALEDWAKQWVEEHLDEKTQLSLGSWVIDRFKKGKTAISLADFETLQKAPKEFANQTEMVAWVDEQGFEQSVRDRVVAAVPATKKVANDVVLCLDAETGEEAWRFEVPGHPSGRGSSSTPAVAGGKVFAALSEHLYCVDAANGKEIWRSPLTGRKGPASSPLVAGESVFLQQNHLSCFDATTGQEIWQNKDAKGSNQSPAIWGEVVLCNSANDLVAVAVASGSTLWTQPGGGDSTPVVAGNHAVVASKTDGANLVAYRLTDGGAEKLWSKDFLARRYGSSPIIHEGHVYHLGSDMHACFALATGEEKWNRPSSSSISSPILVGDTLAVYENRGGFLHLIAADSAEFRSLGRAKVGALYCASPAIDGDSLYIRTADSMARYRFASKNE